MTVRRYFSTDALAPSLTGQAGSLITVLDAVLVNGYGVRAAAGWAKAFSGTNKAAYRGPVVVASPPEGNRFYLRVDDSTNITWASMRGYETMSDVDTGSEPFPTVAQVSGGLLCEKSSSANATVRPWVAVASESFFYFISLPNVTELGSLNNADSCFMFGDFPSYKTGDAFGTLIESRTFESNVQDANFIDISSANSFSATAGHYLARAYTAAAGAVGFCKSALAPAALKSAAGPFCAVEDIMRGLVLSPVVIKEAVAGFPQQSTSRGRVPGMLAILNYVSGAFPFNTGTVVPGVGDFTGRTFLVVQTATEGVFIELTDNSW